MAEVMLWVSSVTERLKVAGKITSRKISGDKRGDEYGIDPVKLETWIRDCSLAGACTASVRGAG